MFKGRTVQQDKLLGDRPVFVRGKMMILVIFKKKESEKHSKDIDDLLKVRKKRN